MWEKETFCLSLLMMRYIATLLLHQLNDWRFLLNAFYYAMVNIAENVIVYGFVGFNHHSFFLWSYSERNIINCLSVGFLHASVMTVFYKYMRTVTTVVKDNVMYLAVIISSRFV